MVGVMRYECQEVVARYHICVKTLMSLKGLSIISRFGPEEVVPGKEGDIEYMTLLTALISYLIHTLEQQEPRERQEPLELPGPLA